MARLYVPFPDIVDIIGEAAAAVLCEHHGGLALYISQTPERSSLVGILGGEAVAALCAELGGIEILIPLGPHRRVLLKERIAAMLETGASHSAIARELRCTTRYAEMVSRDLGFSKPKVQKSLKPKRKVLKQEILATLKNNAERLSVKQIAGRFGVSAGYIYDLRAKHGIPPYKRRK